MRTSIILLWVLLLGLTGCAASKPYSPVQSAFADTHIGWQPAPENQLAYSLTTATGIARVELRQLPEDLDRLTLELPGMRNVEGVQWQGEDGTHDQLYDGGGVQDGVTLEKLRHGFRLQIFGGALDRVRGGGVLTVVDFYRG